MQEKPAQLLTLSMILKDEEATIARTLASVKPFIDRWVIVDTGSTDKTRDVVRRELENVPGELHEREFVDFATTRNVALELAGDATEFVLWLDADDVLENGEVLRASLEREREVRGPDHETYYVRMAAGVHFDSPRITRPSAGWRFKGVVHECLTHPERSRPTQRIADVLIRHDRGQASAERSEKRWSRDIELLKGVLAQEPNDTRAAFYLAQTLWWLRRYREAEVAFLRRIAMGGWAEELFQSKLALARIAMARHVAWPEVMARFLEAHRAASHRAEPLYAIALHYDELGQHALTYLFARRGYDLPRPEKDSHFTDDEIYAWKLADLVAKSAFWIGEFAVGEAAARKATNARPGDERLERNLAYYVERHREDGV